MGALLIMKNSSIFVMNNVCISIYSTSSGYYVCSVKHLKAYRTRGFIGKELILANCNFSENLPIINNYDKVIMNTHIAEA